MKDEIGWKDEIRRTPSLACKTLRNSLQATSYKLLSCRYKLKACSLGEPKSSREGGADAGQMGVIPTDFCFFVDVFVLGWLLVGFGLFQPPRTTQEHPKSTKTSQKPQKSVGKHMQMHMHMHLHMHMHMQMQMHMHPRNLTEKQLNTTRHPPLH